MEQHTFSCKENEQKKWGLSLSDPFGRRLFETAGARRLVFEYCDLKWLSSYSGNSLPFTHGVSQTEADCPFGVST